MCKVLFFVCVCGLRGRGEKWSRAEALRKPFQSEPRTVGGTDAAKCGEGKKKTVLQSEGKSMYRWR